ncbi:PrpF domain-containing protein, partial [Parafrigoribacterium mesophilum]|uniref:PrpF domain-containing protein n=1 Tax=Parafrigoribacterium mesophilum TaxID=433646 RepID=UPI003D15C663
PAQKLVVRFAGRPDHRGTGTVMTTPVLAPDGVRCMVMRGGTSKGAYFLAGDLPSDPAVRDDLLVNTAAPGSRSL